MNMTTNLRPSFSGDIRAVAKITKQDAARKLLGTKPRQVYVHDIEKALQTSKKQRMKAKAIKEIDLAIKDYRDVLVIIVEQ